MTVRNAKYPMSFACSLKKQGSGFFECMPLIKLWLMGHS